MTSNWMYILGFVMAMTGGEVFDRAGVKRDWRAMFGFALVYYGGVLVGAAQ